MSTINIRNARIINEGSFTSGNVLAKNGLIWDVGALGLARLTDQLIDAKGAYLMPGAIDLQLHFREPGLTYEGKLLNKARAVAQEGSWHGTKGDVVTI